MSKSPYKRQPDGALFGLLSERLETWTAGTNPQAASRNPAWCKVYGNGKSVPTDQDDFESLYRSSLKPGPILKDVTLKNGGDFGLIMELEVTIQCHTKEDFIQIENSFLRPGTNVRVEFGYGHLWPTGYQESNNIKGFKVATYAFNTTAEGFWIAKFKAVSPGVALRAINMGMTVEKDVSRKYKGESDVAIVTGIPDLIAYDCQVNGQHSVDSMDDGEVVIPGGGKKGAIVIYKPNHLHGWLANSFGVYGDTNGVTETDNIVYLTLEYVVERLINGEILKQYSKMIHENHRPDFDKLAVKFDSVLSKSYTDQGLYSAWPTKILFMGLNRGNYKANNGNGKDFEGDANKNPAVMCLTKAGTRLEVDLKKILIERSLVLSALEDSYSEKQVAATNDGKESTEGLISLDTFFKKLFNEISKASGGMIKLRLAQHPDIHKGGGGKLPYEMYIFDENNGRFGGSLPCWTFDPIDGDGSIRSCTLTSNVGSNEYQAALFSGQMKQADPVQECCGNMDNGNTEGRTTKRDDAFESMGQILRNPGSLGNDKFDPIHMKTLEGCLGALRYGAPDGKGNDMLMYAGLGIDVEIDGIYGFLPGNAISTTQLPKGYNDAKAYFFVESVTHAFQGDTSDWSTKLEGKLAFNDDVTYLP